MELEEGRGGEGREVEGESLLDSGAPAPEEKAVFTVDVV